MVVIYAIECTENGFAYVGCTSAKLAKRMREHRCLLKANKHAEPALQEDWNRFGESAFRIIPIETVLVDEVAEKRRLELSYMAHYESVGKLYNTRRISFQPPLGAPALAVKKRVANGYRPSAASNLKRRLAQLGKPKGHGAKISATKQAKRLMR